MEIDEKGDVARVLARNVVSIKYEDLPAEAVEAAKKDILDTLATTLAGSTGDGIKVVQELVSDWGGKRESTIIVYGDKVPSLNAALVNATMAHAWDYDDYHGLAGVHAGVSVIPASLAIAERRGKVTGKEFITAIALGIDLMCRLGISIGLIPERLWLALSILLVRAGLHLRIPCFLFTLEACRLSLPMIKN